MKNKRTIRTALDIGKGWLTLTSHSSGEPAEFIVGTKNMGRSQGSNTDIDKQYHSFGKDEVKEFRIDPLHFFENDGGIYIFARIGDFEDIRTLAVERIMELTVMDETFAYPQSLALEEMLDSAFGIVYDDPIEAKIWFSADQARYIKERKWAADQKIIEQEDGSVILEMKTSGWWDVKKWVLSFGAEAEVLEPKKLRDEIIAEIKELRNTYR